LAQKIDGVWRIVAFHNTRIRPMGKTTGGTIVWLIFDRLWRWFGTHGDLLTFGEPDSSG
jgi:hypothetical protein